MSDRDEDEIVRLATATNPAEAHIWQDALEANGIEAKVVGDYLDAGLGDIPGIRAEIWVHQRDLAAAEEILRRSQTEPGEIAEESPEP
jgi:hypothetical protein